MREPYKIIIGLLLLLFLFFCLIAYSVLAFEPKKGMKGEVVKINGIQVEDEITKNIYLPTKYCYCIKNCWYRYCEPDMAVFNGNGYKVLDAFWLRTQLKGNHEQFDNARRWVDWIDESIKED